MEQPLHCVEAVFLFYMEAFGLKQNKGNILEKNVAFRLCWSFLQQAIVRFVGENSNKGEILNYLIPNYLIPISQTQHSSYLYQILPHYLPTKPWQLRYQ